MRRETCKICLGFGVGLVLFAALAMAGNRHDLNGTWALEPTRSSFEGQPAIQTGTVTINDRQHNIFVSRNFNYDGADESFEYAFTTDGRENSSIRQGKTFKSKAKWEGDALRVTTIDNGATTVERFSLAPDGSLMLVVERPEHRPITLYFQRR
jgi:hypothetical protein